MCEDDNSISGTADRDVVVSGGGYPCSLVYHLDSKFPTKQSMQVAPNTIAANEASTGMASFPPPVSDIWLSVDVFPEFL